MMTGEWLARVFHEVCAELGPGEDPPVVIPPWDELPEEQRQRKIRVATKVLKRIGSRDTEEIKVE